MSLASTGHFLRARNDGEGVTRVTGRHDERRHLCGVRNRSFRAARSACVAQALLPAHLCKGDPVCRPFFASRRETGDALRRPYESEPDVETRASHAAPLRAIVSPRNRLDQRADVIGARAAATTDDRKRRDAARFDHRGRPFLRAVSLDRVAPVELLRRQRRRVRLQGDDPPSGSPPPRAPRRRTRRGGYS